MAREEQRAVKQSIEEQIAFYDDRFRFGEWGEDAMEKKEVTFQRGELYEEIWQISLSKVAKKYEVPYQDEEPLPDHTGKTAVLGNRF